jgi:outer membrane protein TolC
MRIPPLLCLLATGAACAAEPPLQLDPLVQEALRHNAGSAAPPFEQRKLASRVKQAYVRLQHAWRIQETIERERELLRSLLRVAEANYSNGKGLEQDALKAQVQISLLEPRLIEAQSGMRAHGAELNAFLGRPGDSALGRPASDLPKTLAVTLEELQAKAGADAPTDPIREDYRTAQVAAAQWNVYELTILPQARFAAHASLVSYESGSSDFLNVLADYTALIDAEKKRDDLELDFFLALVHLEELTGVELIH